MYVVLLISLFPVSLFSGCVAGRKGGLGERDRRLVNEALCCNLYDLLGRIALYTFYPARRSIHSFDPDTLISLCGARMMGITASSTAAVFVPPSIELRALAFSDENLCSDIRTMLVYKCAAKPPSHVLASERSRRNPGKPSMRAHGRDKRDAVKRSMGLGPVAGRPR